LEIFKEVKYTSEYELEEGAKDWPPLRSVELGLLDLAWTILTNE
jgi:hypothetical protein